MNFLHPPSIVSVAHVRLYNVWDVERLAAALGGAQGFTLQQVVG